MIEDKKIVGGNVMYEILRKEVLNSTVEKMVVKAPFIARKCLAGQFLMVMVCEDGERVPLTIADYDRNEESVTIVYQVVGYSTKLLSEKKVGEFLFAVSGPMGKPVEHKKGVKRILGIGGGVGAAPLLPQISLRLPGLGCLLLALTAPLYIFKMSP